MSAIFGNYNKSIQTLTNRNKSIHFPYRKIRSFSGSKSGDFSMVSVISVLFRHIISDYIYSIYTSEYIRITSVILFGSSYTEYIQIFIGIIIGYIHYTDTNRIYTTVIHRKHSNYYRILHHNIRYMVYIGNNIGIWFGYAYNIELLSVYTALYTVLHESVWFGTLSAYFRYRLFAFTGPYSDIFVGTVADTFRKNLFVIRHSRGIYGHFTKKKRVSNPNFPKSATVTTTPISAFVYFC